MSEFDWFKLLMPVNGADTHVSCEELYQAFKERLAREISEVNQSCIVDSLEKKD